MCFVCDDTYEICNICGENPNACECSEEEIREYAAEHGDGPDDISAHWGDCECADREPEAPTDA